MIDAIFYLGITIFCIRRYYLGRKRTQLHLIAFFGLQLFREYLLTVTEHANVIVNVLQVAAFILLTIYALLEKEEA